MPITGKFLADFSTFYDAVQKAEVSLRSFETGAGKVEKSLNRMTDSFSGRKILSEAELAVRAVNDIGGATRLTESEQRKLNATLTEAIAKTRALGFEASKDMLALANATRDAATATQGFSKSGSFLSDLTTQIKATALGFISAQAIIGSVQTGIRTLTTFISNSVTAYAAQETAVKRMTTALQAQGHATPDVIEQYKRLASQFQNTTVFSDELINEMQALLVEVGNVAPAQMEKALKASTDLASGLGIDLKTATMLVGKAFEGETGTLKRYGIVIDEAKLKTEGASAVMDAIQQKFGGQAQAEVETYAGKVKQLANAWGELQEAVGAVIVQDPALEAVMRAAKDRILGVTDAAGNRSQATILEWWNTLAGNTGVGNALFFAVIEHMSMVENATARINAQMAAMKPKTPGLFSPSAPPPVDFDVSAYLKQSENEAEAHKKAGSAAKQHADMIRELAAAYSGAKDIKAAENAIEALNLNLQRGIPIAKMTRDQQDAVNKAVGNAIEVYRALGRDAPAAIRSLYSETLNLATLAPKVGAVGDEFKSLFAPLSQIGEFVSAQLTPSLIDSVGYTTKFGHEWARVGEQITPVPPKIKLSEDHTRELSQALSELASISGGAFSQIIADLAVMVRSFEVANAAVKDFKGGLSALKSGEILSGILGMSTGILGIASAAIAAGKAIANMFDRNKGRDVVVDFADMHGGFDQLHNELLALGADGEQLWIRLTQGVGRNNPAQAQAAIEAINEALAHHKDALDEATAAAAQMSAAESSGFKALEEFMRPDELKALTEGFKKAQIEGFKGSEEEFLKQQLEFYGKLEEGDERLKTYFYQNTVAAFKAMQEGFGDAALKMLADIKAINDQIKGLQDSIANEAPEEVMGVIEQQTRAQIAALEEQRAAAQETFDDVSAAAEEMAENTSHAFKDKFTSAAEAAAFIMAGDLQHTLDAADFVARLRFEYELPEDIQISAGLNLPGFASGTRGQYLNFGAGTPVMLHGREKISTLGDTSGGNEQPIYIQLDGHTLGRALLRHVSEAAQSYGLA